MNSPGEQFAAVIAGNYEVYKRLVKKLGLVPRLYIYFHNRDQGHGTTFHRVIYTCGYDRVDPVVKQFLKPYVARGVAIEYISCCELPAPGTH